MSYNVFADMGFENPEEELLKSEIVSALRSLIDEKKLTVQQVAERWHMEPSLLPELFRGSWGEYSVSQLLRLAAALGGTLRVSLECYEENRDFVSDSPDSVPEEAKRLALTA